MLLDNSATGDFFRHKIFRLQMKSGFQIERHIWVILLKICPLNGFLYLYPYKSTLEPLQAEFEPYTLILTKDIQ